MPCYNTAGFDGARPQYSVWFNLNLAVMMTPNTEFDFWYEINYSDGSKFNQMLSSTYGVWGAYQKLEEHGIKISFTTIGKAFKDRVYAFSKMSYGYGNTESECLAHFNRISSGKQVVGFHLGFKRIR